MKIECIGSTEYSKIFNKHFIPYNSVAFNLYNSSKCDRVNFFLFHKGKVNIGLIGGVKDNSLLTPFSAPFSSFSVNDNNIGLEYILNAIALLEEYLIKDNFNLVKFILPPCFYNQHFISKLIYSFYQSNYSIIIDENHLFYTKDYVKYENNSIKKGVRYNLKVANKAALVFKKANTYDEYVIAYDVIRVNKETKHYPLKMTFNQINDMRSIIDIDFFIVYYKDIPIASSIVYNYSPAIAQIIYWGDLPDYSCYYPMNFLAKNIFRYYRDNKIDIIDLGNSSACGVPNFGLSNFKEIIGCTATVKFTFLKNLQEANNVH